MIWWRATAWPCSLTEVRVQRVCPKSIWVDYGTGMLVREFLNGIAWRRFFPEKGKAVEWLAETCGKYVTERRNALVACRNGP